MSAAWRNAALRAWRLAALVGVGLAVGAADREARRGSAMPLGLREVARIVPGAAALEAEAGPHGQVVRDAAGAALGTALTTSPAGDAARGYAGPSEVLLVLDPELRVVGARLRRSEDTAEHVADVVAAGRFWAGFAGRPAAELAGRRGSGVDGVSGATMTSAAVVDAIGLRLAEVVGAAEREGGGPGFTLHDLALIAFAFGGVLLSFHRGARRRLRGWFRLAAVAYLGVFTAELLALSMGAGFARRGLPFGHASGVAVLAATAWLLPWASGRSPYCAQICPHGALQEWLARAVRGRGVPVRLPRALRRTLVAVPAALLVVAVLALALGLPLDLAGLEAFDAWLCGAAAVASLWVAVVGLAVSAVEPMAYCRYGCATGRLLGLGTTHPRSGGRLGGGDALLAALLLVAVAGWLGRGPIRELLAEGPW
jgi:hypothetical protein